MKLASYQLLKLHLLLEKHMGHIHDTSNLFPEKWDLTFILDLEHCHGHGEDWATDSMNPYVPSSVNVGNRRARFSRIFPFI